MRPDRLVLAAISVALLYGAASPVLAGGGTKPHVDEKRGFSVKVPDTFKLNPPKPTGDAKCNAGEFYDDQAKYKSSGSQNPEFKIMWWSTPKAVVTPGAKPSAEPEAPKPPTTRAEAMDEYGPKSVDEIVDQLIEWNTQLFGSNKPPMSERWATGKAGKTTKQKIDFQYVEINTVKPKEKDKNAPVWCLVVARLKIERPLESVNVGFYGTFAKEFVKDLLPAYLNIVKSFETRDAIGVKAEEIPTDPVKYLDWLKRTKVIEGWKFWQTPKKQYAVIYDASVKDDLIHDIGTQIEAIRGQVYEKLFPPDKPVTAISVIRVCKDPEQYRAYGGSGGSAGYWSWIDQELVFYKDSQNPKDALRVLYHEAFHQYIFYSVGACSPHSWFNEGHGDYFAGHNYGGGKFERDTFSWRKDLAAQLKREKRTAPLKEWLTWGQSEYYGAPNKWKLDGGENYALGWSFIYFLRTTKKPEYQGILERYFNCLKGLVTKKREERRLAREKAKAAGEDVGAEEPEGFANMSFEDDWCAQALAEGLKGVDVEQLEKDWLADSP
jgi:hypothetical protein